MEIRIRNLEEYILFLICLSGEPNISCLKESMESKDYLKNTLWDMEKNRGEIKRYAPSGKDGKKQGRKVLRLKYKKGDEAARRISEEMYIHLGLISGKNEEGKLYRYKGPDSLRERRRNQAVLIQKIYSMGIPVDYLFHSMYEALDRRSVFTEGGELRKGHEILGDASESRCFFTARTLFSDYMLPLERTKDQGYGKRIKRMDMTRCYGVLVRGSLVFPVYYVTADSYRWAGNAESVLRYAAESLAKKAGLLEKNEKLEEAVFYTKEKSIIRGILNPKGGKNGAMRPYDVYRSHAYFLPFDENHEDILDVITTYGGAERMNRMIKRKEKEECKVYNFLLSDITYMRNARMEMSCSEDKGKKAVVYVHDWQKEMIEEYLKGKATLREVGKEEFRDMTLRTEMEAEDEKDNTYD